MQKQKSTIAAFFDAPGFDEYPFSIEEYRIAYREVADIMQEKGSELRIVRGQKTYLGKNRFSGGWAFDRGRWERIDEPFATDLIYDKGYFKADDGCRVLNDRALDDLCTDKWKTYAEFAAICPKTFLVHTREDLATALKSIPGDIVVAKPKDGQEAKGIVIGSREEVLKDFQSFPGVAQEYLDSSGGIPGITDGMHDFRIICVRGEIGACYIRVPAPGKKVANVSQGGKEIPVPIEKIPKDALALFRKVEEQVNRYPFRVYCIDMVREKRGGWKLIELNSKPGLSWQWAGKQYRAFQEKLADTLLKAAEAGNPHW